MYDNGPRLYLYKQQLESKQAWWYMCTAMQFEGSKNKTSQRQTSKIIKKWE
jgi:hypothetical protein